MLNIFKKYKTGLVLSGGGARGVAHLGVLQALQEKKIKPSVLSAVSAGALASAFYADGYAPQEILEFFSNRKAFDLMRITFPRSGFLKVKGLKSILKKNLRAKNIEDLKTPVIIGVTNFREGKMEYLEKGNLVDALLASAGIPILFEVQHINKVPYIDGGVMDNLPVNPILGRCRKTIAVHVNPKPVIKKIQGPVQVAERAFFLAIAAEVQNKKEKVDLFIEPPGLMEYGMLDVKKAKEIYEIGYKYAKEVLET